MTSRIVSNLIFASWLGYSIARTTGMYHTKLAKMSFKIFFQYLTASFLSIFFLVKYIYMQAWARTRYRRVHFSQNQEQQAVTYPHNIYCCSIGTTVSKVLIYRNIKVSECRIGTFDIMYPLCFECVLFLFCPPSPGLPVFFMLLLNEIGNL